MTEKQKLMHRYIQLYLVLIAIIAYPIYAMSQGQLKDINETLRTFGYIYMVLGGIHMATPADGKSALNTFREFMSASRKSDEPK